MEDPVIATIVGNDIYLNRLADSYLIDFSPDIVGDVVWYVGDILAGTPPPEGRVPKDIFPMVQVNAKLYFQNISGIPIKVIFDNDISKRLTFFLYEEKRAKDYEQVILPGGSLILETRFANNSVIHFVNVYNDSTIDYLGLSKVMDNAIKARYIPSIPIEQAARVIQSQEDHTKVVAQGDGYYIDVVAAEATSFSNVVFVTSRDYLLTIDGTTIGTDEDIYGSDKGSLMVAVLVDEDADGYLVLKGLDNESKPKYSGDKIRLTAGSSFFVTVMGKRVVIIDFLGTIIGAAALGAVKGGAAELAKGLPALFEIGKNVLGGALKGAIQGISGGLFS